MMTAHRMVLLSFLFVSEVCDVAEMTEEAKQKLVEAGKKTRFTSGAEAAQAGRAGGQASQKKYKETKTLREAVRLVMSLDVEDPKIREALEALGLDPTYRNAMSLKMAAKAASGSEKAFEVVRDTAGEAPKLSIGLSADPASAEDLKSLSEEELEQLIARGNSET